MKLTLAVVSIAALGAAAPGAAGPDAGLPVLAVRDLGDKGLLTFYGRSAAAKEMELSTRACGDNIVACYPTNLAPSFLCNDLINEVCGNMDLVPAGTRSICEGSGERCCISWNTDVGSFPRDNLCDAARATYNRCSGSSVSGVASSVNLNGVCGVHQCLSDRAEGC